MVAEGLTGGTRRLTTCARPRASLGWRRCRSRTPIPAAPRSLFPSFPFATVIRRSGSNFAFVFFVLFTIIGALVLLTLFIGVVTTSMDEATEEMHREFEVENRVKAFAARSGISADALRCHRMVFSMLDVDGGGTIGEAELGLGLGIIGKHPSPGELREMMREVDEDGSDEIDFCEFVEFMSNLAQRAPPEIIASPPSSADIRDRSLQAPRPVGAAETHAEGTPGDEESESSESDMALTS